MRKEIVVDAQKDQTRIAIVEDGDLVELYFEDAENTRTLGNIYLGRVRRIMPSIRAAFVDIGQKQDAFLHFSDLAEPLPEMLDFLEVENPVVGASTIHQDQSSKSRRHRPKGQRGGKKGGSNGGNKKGKRGIKDAQTRRGRRSAQRRKKKNLPTGNSPRARAARRRAAQLDQYLKRDQRILVKIIKEPISNKGSRVSTDISLAGRFLVLVPFSNYAAVSKRISSYKERRRLRALAKMLLPDGFGVIVRTVAEGKDAKTLDTDLRLLLEKWRSIEANLAGNPKPPKEVYQDVNMVSSIMRDLFSSDYDRILIDDQRLHRSIRNYVQAVAPQMTKAVKLYKGKQPVFENAKIHREMEEAFQSRVSLPSGGYLFIERTEAMHVIDVNSGRSGRGMSQEESSLKVNLEAARVIARQLRLRDIGGIIVVDFIDLRSDKNRQKVYDELKKEFRKDRAVTKILPMSDFGLIEITRQRLRPSITTTFSLDEEDAEASAANDGGRSTKGSSKGSSDKSRQGNGKPRGDRSRGGRRSSKSDGDSAGGTDSGEPTPSDEDKGSQEDKGKRRGGRGGRGRGRGDRGDRAPDPQKMLHALDRWLSEYKGAGNRRAVVLRVHPFTAAYLNKRVPTYPTRWFMKHLIRVRIDTDEGLRPGAFRFHDARGGDELPRRPGEAQQADDDATQSQAQQSEA